ncbi:MAG: 3-dehydroquinate synthase family protein, partial [Acidobacteriota bacterium]
MITIQLTCGDRRAPYYLGPGVSERIAELCAAELACGRPFVVTDANVGPLHGQAIADQLGASCLELPAGEEHKRWTSVEAIARWLLAGGVERRDLVIAVGGGVLTDLAGFAASVTLRGLAWAAVPTTLLGMVDAAIGGKTGIDLDLGKNLLGTFWHPVAVIADPLLLATLDPRQLRAGLAEVVKAAMVSPPGMEDLLDTSVAALLRGEAPAATELIGAAVRVKAEIVGLDEREHGPRAALNLGHTLGHALEAATEYRRFLHGEAVAWGLLAALRLARDRGLLGTASAQGWASRVGWLAPLPALS